MVFDAIQQSNAFDKLRFNRKRKIPQSRYIHSSEQSDINSIKTLNNEFEINKNVSFFTKYQEYQRNGHIYTISFSPDGTKLAMGGKDKKAVLYDTLSQEKLFIFYREDKIRVVAFSHDSKKLVVGGEDKKAPVYDTSSGEKICMFQRDDSILAAAFTPNGKRLVLAGSDKKAVIYDIASEERWRTFSFDFIVKATAFSPDETKLAIGGFEKSVYLYDILSGELINSYNSDNFVTQIIFAPEGSSFVVISAYGMATIYSVSTREKLKTFPCGAIGRTAAFSPDGHKFALGSYTKARIFDIANGSIFKEIQHDDQIFTLAFSPDGSKLAIGGKNRKATIYAISNIDIVTFVEEERVETLAFSPDGINFVVGEGNRAVVYDSYSTGKIHVFNQDSRVNAAAFAPNGDFIAINSHKTFIYDISCNSVVFSIDSGEAWKICFSPDGDRIAIISVSKKVFLYDLSNKSEMKSFLFQFHVVAADFTPDGNILVIGGKDDEGIIVYDITKGEMEHMVFDGCVRALAISPDQTKLIVGGTSKKVILYDFEKRDELCTFDRNEAIFALAFTPDGNKFAIGDESNNLSFYDSITWKCSFSFLSTSPIRNLSITYHIQMKSDFVALSSKNLVYTFFIYQYGPHECLLPVGDLLQGTRETHYKIVEFAKLTNGDAMLKRNDDGKNLLATAVQLNLHKLVAELISLFPANALASTPAIRTSNGIMKCLYEYNHLTSIKNVLTSGSYKSSTSEINLTDIATVLLIKFARSNNLDGVMQILEAGEKGCSKGFVLHHDTYRIDTTDNPLNRSLLKSSCNAHDFTIWNNFKKDDRERIRMKTVRVLLPDLGSFATIHALLRLESNDPFSALAMQAVIECHWKTWAKRFLFYRCIVFLGWVICLTILCESSWNRRFLSNGDIETNIRAFGDYTLFFCVCVGLGSWARQKISHLLKIGLKSFLSMPVNIWQLAAIFSSMIFLVVEIMQLDDFIVTLTSALALFFSWNNIFYCFRLHDQCSWLIQSLIAESKEILPFFFIVFAMIWVWALTIRSLFVGGSLGNESERERPNLETIPNAFEVIFFMSLFADFDSDILFELVSRPLSMILVCALLLIVSIVALNALISLIGDIFDRILEDQFAVVIRIKAETILELYTHVGKDMQNKLEKDNRWTYKLVPAKDLEEIHIRPINFDRKQTEHSYRKANKSDLQEVEKKLKREIETIEIKLNALFSEMRNVTNEIKRGFVPAKEKSSL